MSGPNVVQTQEWLQSLGLRCCLASFVVMLATWLVVLCLRNHSAALRHRVLYLGLAGVVMLPALVVISQGMSPTLRMAVHNPSASTEPYVVDDGLDDQPQELFSSPEPESYMHQFAGVNDTLPVAVDADSKSAIILAEDIQLNQSPLPVVPANAEIQPVAFSWPAIPLWSLPFLAWALVAGGLALRDVQDRLLLKQSLRSSIEVTEERALQMLRSIANDHGIRGAALLCSESLQVPVAIGVLRPAIVLPAGYGKWSDDRLHIVLLHEMMHIGRADVLAQSVAGLACVLCWFNPLVWRAASRMRLERELASDDSVLLAGEDAVDYADHLVEIAAVIGQRFRVPAAASAMATQSNMRSRVSRLMRQDVDRSQLSRRAATTLLLLTAVVVTCLTLATPTIAMTPDDSAAMVVDTTADEGTEAPISGDLAVLPFAATVVSRDEPASQADSARPSRTPDSQETAYAPAHTDAKVEEFTPIAFTREVQVKLGGIDQLEFSPDGTSLFVAARRSGDLRFSGRKPTTYWVERWNVENWKKLSTLENVAAPFTPAKDSQSVIALPASEAHSGPPYGQIGKANLYDLAGHTNTTLFDVSPRSVTGVAQSPDGQSVAACSGAVAVWGKDGSKTWEHSWHQKVSIGVVEWSADGKVVFGAGDGGTFAWKSDTGEEVWKHDDHPFNVESLARSADGKYLATASYIDPSSGFGVFGRAHCIVMIRDTKSGKPIRTVKLYHDGVVRPLDLAFAPDGRTFAVALGSYNRGQHWGEVRVVDVESGETTATLLKDHPQPVTSVAYSPDGDTLAAGTFDDQVKLWRVSADHQIVIDGPLADAIFNVIFGADFLDGLGDAIGESIERDLREKLGLKTEMDRKLFDASCDLWDRLAIEGAGSGVAFIHLLLPSDEPQQSTTIVLNTSEDAVPFLRLTRSYGLVTRPTASITFTARGDGSRPAAGEALLIWKEGQWVEVEREQIEATIE